METNVLGANIGFAAVAGLAGALVMLVLIYLLKMVGFKVDLPYIMGTIFVKPEKKSSVYGLGLVIYFIIGAMYGMFFIIQMMGITQPPQWWLGIVYGFASAFLSGVLLGTLADDHPNMGEGKEISNPGMFATNWGLGNTATFFIIHIIFGLVTLMTYIHLYGPTYIPRISSPLF
ncbi:MAG TPA: hypothetical protein VJ991_03285 [Balneolales bacterium]|nr:hypothetical protein [Balneolales bacterium]